MTACHEGTRMSIADDATNTMNFVAEDVGSCRAVFYVAPALAGDAAYMRLVGKDFANHVDIIHPPISMNGGEQTLTRFIEIPYIVGDGVAVAPELATVTGVRTYAHG